MKSLETLISCLFPSIATCAHDHDGRHLPHTAQIPFAAPSESSAPVSISFSPTWSLLGPFQIGTREAPWGADPLEYHGGFPSLEIDENAAFRSSLARNASVRWRSVNASSTFIHSSSSEREMGGRARTSVKVKSDVSFPEVDWTFLTHVYGWSALQWQAWVRGEFYVSPSSTSSPTSTSFSTPGQESDEQEEEEEEEEEEEICILLSTPQILEYAIDSHRYFGGDFYTLPRAAQHILRLKSGWHTLDVRLVRDVRVMGGIGAPNMNVEIGVGMCEGEREGGLVVVQEGAVVSDVVEGVLGSEFVSVDVRNEGVEWIRVTDLRIDDGDEEEESSTRTHIEVSILNNAHIAPGQTKPLILSLAQPPGSKITTSHLHLVGTLMHSPSRISQTTSIHSLRIILNLTHKSSPSSPFKLTHRHPSGIISYSILLPPSLPANSTACPRHVDTQGAPILLQLHGAGVDVDSRMVYEVIASFPPLCAWLLFPSGVTTWSGDDWHTWGFGDVLSSIHSIRSWIQRSDWKGVGVDSKNWVVGGHSNGGQGTWYTLLHYPDSVVAAAPVSGYTSIQAYVPYTFWHPSSSSSSRQAGSQTGVLEAVLNEYRHEGLVGNARGVPVLIQHGGEDDNVPTYHSRLMAQLLAESGSADSSRYFEVPRGAHWWDGVVTTPPLLAFYHEHIANAHEERKVPDDGFFEIVVANPVEMGARFGVRVLYLRRFGVVGRVSVRRKKMMKKRGGDGEKEGEVWVVETENVMGFEWPRGRLGELGGIDGVVVGLVDSGREGDEEGEGVVSFWKDAEGRWSTTKPTSQLRDPAHFGGLNAILRTNHPFTIAYAGHQKEKEKGTYDLALQVSRNMHTYFHADCDLVELDVDVDEPYLAAAFANEEGVEEGRTEKWEGDLSGFGNRILLSVGHGVPYYLCAGEFSIRICPAPTQQSPSSPPSDGEVTIHPQMTLSRHTANKPQPQIFNSSEDEPLGAIFLRPLQDEDGLELVVWGSDSGMVQQAARLIPMMTGSGQPDWVVLRRRGAWMGAGGVEMGFFDWRWRVQV